MVLYQLKNLAIPDAEGNGHEIVNGILTGKVIPKAELEANYSPLPHQG